MGIAYAHLVTGRDRSRYRSDYDQGPALVENKRIHHDGMDRTCRDWRNAESPAHRRSGMAACRRRNLHFGRSHIRHQEVRLLPRQIWFSRGLAYLCDSRCAGAFHRHRSVHRPARNLTFQPSQQISRELLVRG